LTHIRSTASNP